MPKVFHCSACNGQHKRPVGSKCQFKSNESLDVSTFSNQGVQNSDNLNREILMALIFLFIYLFGVLRRFQHCTGHITTGSWKGRGNQYIWFTRVVYCKLPTNGKQVPAFPFKAITGIEPRPQRWEARVLPLCHRGPF